MGDVVSEDVEVTLRFPAAHLPAMRTLIRALDEAKEREARVHHARALAVEHDRVSILAVPTGRIEAAAELAFMVLGPLREGLTS
jgi:hypothetical protein